VSTFRFSAERQFSSGLFRFAWFQMHSARSVRPPIRVLIDSARPPRSESPCGACRRACVQALGIFTNDDKIDILRLLVFKGVSTLGYNFTGRSVDVLVKLEPPCEGGVFFEYPRLHIRMSGSRRGKCVVFPELGKDAVGIGFRPCV